MTKEVRYCTIDGCGRVYFAKDWCQRHYHKNYKYGNPLAGPDISTLAPDAECSVEGCDIVGKIRHSYCTLHYHRFMKTGDPGHALHRHHPDRAEENFWAKIDKTGGDEACWPWNGGDIDKGYGKLRVGGKYTRAHRFSYEVSYGVKLGSHEPVHHKCSNTMCANPRHLQVITPQENTAEMLERRYYQQRIAELEKALEACTCT